MKCRLISTREIQNRFDRYSERLMLLLPDWITGDSETMRRKFRVKYGIRDCSAMIRDRKIKLMKSYLILTALFAFLLVIAVLGIKESGEIQKIRKPESGEGAFSLPVKAEMNYDGIRESKNISLKIRQRALSQTEKKLLLEQYKDGLKGIIRGENEGLGRVSKPLNLPEQDPDTGITLVWTSSHPHIIDKTGDVDLLAAEDGQTVELTVQLTLEDVALRESYRIKMDKNAPAEAYIRNMEKRLVEAVEQLSERGTSEYVQLPGELENGIKVRWYAGGESSASMMILLYGVTVLILFFKRYDRIDREIKESRSSVAKDLPELINKLVLLLNAGLVVSSAFAKIVSDYENYYPSGELLERKEKRHLYEGLLEIQKRTDQSNVSLIGGLKEFSQRSGVRDLVRLTAIISDNWHKGSTLAEKLECEVELLWISRKKKAEEKGKLAETKLTLPLMILLIVLIMVTIAPALLEM